MAICELRGLLLTVCIIELIITVQRQVFDFLGFMWVPIIANFVNILLIIFGSFGAVQYITKYLIAYAIWSFMWLTWNTFLICYYLNLGSLNRESGLLSFGTGSVSWWEGNGWGCQTVWSEEDGPGSLRPTRVDGCFLPWHHVELTQSAVAAILTIAALPLSILLTIQSYKRRKPSGASVKGTLPRRPVYTIELSPTETNVSESSLKPMTPRRVKRRSGSRGAGSSVRRSRRSYRNSGYLASTASLPREPRSRPTSAHSSYSNFHAARPASYHAPDPDPSRPRDVYEPPPPTESITITTQRYDTIRGPGAGYDVAGPYDRAQKYDHRNYESNPTYGNVPQEYSGPYAGRESPFGAGWQALPPPAPPYSARATPQAPGPPAYQQNDYDMMP
ncbi:sodium/potassium-transporting ATPase subunit beta-1-interacting protein 4 [Cydia pomonella]|uniref:sodium/potassium-transporting ATPase subunit beta-1-interacting protein 4 n=1 Tax=Cydia pomonella TaxID=82600 RepID=UPI002ADDDC54|nr:sodium/potassium-transporting ATPase subunit beta-1-interacting protein 4 [Cydia pomonella]